MQKAVKGTLCAMLAGIVWGTMSIFVENLKGIGVSTMSIVFLRTTITAVFLGVCLSIFKPSLLKIKLKDIWIFLGNGILSLVFFTFCYFNAIVKSSAAIAAVLLYTAPVFVMLLSLFFFKERLTKLKLLACGIAILGCVLTSGLFESKSAISIEGILFGLASGFCYALYSIFTGAAIKKGYSSLTIIFYSFLFACLASMPLADLKNTLPVILSSWSPILYTLGMGVVTAIIPYFLYTTALNNIEASKASIIASIELVVASLVGYLCFGQGLSFISILGIILVLLSIVILNVKFKRN